MKGTKSEAVWIFLGLLLTAVFAVGLACERNPGAFLSRYSYDFAREQFCAFCREFWIPAGIIGIPMLLITVCVSLARDRKRER